MIIRARAPLRISFGGGGTDVPPYCDEKGGAVLNATINRFAYATVVPGGDTIRVRSLDYDASIAYGIDEQVSYDGQLGLAKAVIDHFRRERALCADGTGLDVFLHNDAPPGSGLGSSSAITVALICALAERCRLGLDSYQIADLAYHIERVEVGQKGGKQDQFCAAFGGFNFMEFCPNNVTIVNSLRLRSDIVYELQYSLAFAYVGGPRFSSHIIEQQQNNYANKKSVAVEAMDRLKELAVEMKRTLLLGRLVELGGLLDEAWTAKTRMAEGISNDHIAGLYAAARAAGALGGKITGAGGGGFMFFLCDPYRRFAVQEALRARGAQVVDFSFVEEGARTWKASA